MGAQNCTVILGTTPSLSGLLTCMPWDVCVVASPHCTKVVNNTLLYAIRIITSGYCPELSKKRQWECNVASLAITAAKSSILSCANNIARLCNATQANTTRLPVFSISTPDYAPCGEGGITFNLKVGIQIANECQAMAQKCVWDMIVPETQHSLQKIVHCDDESRKEQLRSFFIITGPIIAGVCLLACIIFGLWRLCMNPVNCHFKSRKITSVERRQEVRSEVRPPSSSSSDARLKIPLVGAQGSINMDLLHDNRPNYGT